MTILLGGEPNTQTDIRDLSTSAQITELDDEIARLRTLVERLSLELVELRSTLGVSHREPPARRDA